MKIKVTQEHIDQGRVSGERYMGDRYMQCPIASALSEVLNGEWVVTSKKAYKWGSGSEMIRLSKECTIFICDFDRGRKVAPFEFETNILES